MHREATDSFQQPARERTEERVLLYQLLFLSGEKNMSTCTILLFRSYLTLYLATRSRSRYITCVLSKYVESREYIDGETMTVMTSKETAKQ